MEQAAATVGADAASAAVAAAAGGDTVVHDADAVDFDVHPADDDTELAVADGTGPGTAAAVVPVAGIAAAVVPGAETAVGALAVDAVADSGRFVCAPAPAAPVAAPPAHPSLASPCHSEIVLAFQL